MKFDLSTNLVRLAFFALVIGFLFLLGYGLRSLALPFAVSFLVAFLLVPLVNEIEGFGVPRWVAALFTLSGLIGVLSLIGYVVVPYASSEVGHLRAPVRATVTAENFHALTAFQTPMQDLIGEDDSTGEASSEEPPTADSTKEETEGGALPDQLPQTIDVADYQLRAANLAIQLSRELKQMPLPDSVQKHLEPGALVLRARRTAAGLLPSDFSFVGSLVTNLLIAPVVLIVFLLQGDSIFKRLMAMIPNRYFEMTLSLVHNIRSSIISYIKGLSLQWMIFGSVLTLGLYIGGIPGALVLGTLAATCNVVPYVGPALGLIPALVTALVTPDASVLSVLAAFGAAQLVDNAFTQPVVLAGSVQIHPLIAILTLIALQQLLGVIGMVIAIPFASIVLVSIEIMYRQMKAFNVI